MSKKEQIIGFVTTNNKEQKSLVSPERKKEIKQIITKHKVALDILADYDKKKSN